MSNTGPATWDIMTKIMGEVNLEFWARAFVLTKKTFYPKKNTNPMELYISEEKPNSRTLKQILIPTTQISIRNPIWHHYSWDIRKLKKLSSCMPTTHTRMTQVVPNTTQKDENSGKSTPNIASTASNN